MNATQMSQMIGRVGSMYLRDECTVRVRITDVKISYGNVRYLVEPLAGAGQCWISEPTIMLEAQPITDDRTQALEHFLGTLRRELRGE